MYWPFINEKQSMFTFALAFFAGHRFFFFSFSTSFRFSWEEEEGIWKKAFTMTTTDHNYICQTLNVKLIALLALQHTFIFSERKCISKSWRKLMNYKRQNRIPWLSLTVPTLRRVSLRDSKIEAIRYSDRRFNTRDWIYLIYVLQKQNFIFSLYLQWA